MDDLSSLAVVILNYNAFADTCFCVRRLSGFCSGMHLIIVDNQSPDGSFEKLKHEFDNCTDIEVLQSAKNGGYSYGNNFGIRYALQTYHPEYIGIMNPDVIINQAEIFYTMCEALAKIDQLAIVGAGVLNADGVHEPSWSGWSIPTAAEIVLDQSLLRKGKKHIPQKNLICDNICRTDCVAGSFFIAKRDKFEQMGLFDEHVFLYNEENILGIKCRQRGWLEGIVLNQYYIHNHRMSTNAAVSLRQKMEITKQGYLSRKYLCRTYYHRFLLPLLALVECSNRIFLLLSYVRNRIILKKCYNIY